MARRRPVKAANSRKSTSKSAVTAVSIPRPKPRPPVSKPILTLKPPIAPIELDDSDNADGLEDEVDAADVGGDVVDDSEDETDVSFDYLVSTLVKFEDVTVEVQQTRVSGMDLLLQAASTASETPSYEQDVYAD